MHALIITWHQLTNWFLGSHVHFPPFKTHARLEVGILASSAGHLIHLKLKRRVRRKSDETSDRQPNRRWKLYGGERSRFFATCAPRPFFWQVDAPPPAETKNPRGVFQWNASWGLMEYTWTVIGLECNKNVLIHTACKWGTSHKAFYYREIRLWDASLGFQWHAVPFKRYSV